MKNILLGLIFVFQAQLSFASASGGPKQVDSVSDYYGSEQSVPCLEGYACPQAQPAKPVETISNGADASGRPLKCTDGYDTTVISYNKYQYCNEIGKSWNAEANPIVCSQSIGCRAQVKTEFNRFVVQCGRSLQSNSNYDLLFAAIRKACGTQ